MKGPELLIGIWRAIEAADGKPTINNVRVLARMAGARIRQADAYRILAPFRDSENTREQTRNNPGTRKASSGNNPGTTPVVPRARPVKVLSPKITSSLRSEAPEQSWVLEVRKATEGLSSRELRSLTPDERFVLARYHAAIFAYCNSSERNNRIKAQNIATGIKNLADKIGRNPLMADLTVREYVGHGRRVHKRTGEAPWWKPLDVYESIEIAPA